MIERLRKLRGRIGDFWYYSLMLFVACRAADVLNAFVGLWLVPKYVDSAELGAVMPLTAFATTLAVPASVFSMTFMKEVNSLAERGEYGKMKTLMRGVFITVGIFLVAAIVISRFVLPMFLERIRIVEGSLGFLVIAAAFIGCTAPIYQNALQALKKFSALSLLSILGAPIRFLVMIVAMPFRPLSGFFVGQAATPAFTIITSVLCLRKELSVRAEPYWSGESVRRLTGIFLGVTGYMLFANLVSLVEMTVLRQRLPDLDSAAYYMVTRFSDMTTLVSATLTTTLFPYAASLSERGASSRPLVVRASLATIAFSVALAAFFALFGRPLLAFFPNGSSIASFSWAIPWLIGINLLGALQGFYVTAEVSAARFSFLRWWIPLHLAYPAILLFVTGHGYFASLLPASVADFLCIHQISALPDILVWFTAFGVLKFVCSLVGIFCTNPENR